MALRQARILSSETDNTIKQEQNVDVNIRIEKQPKQQNNQNIAQNVQPQQSYSHISAQPSNFTIQAPLQEGSLYPSVAPTNSLPDTTNLENEIAELSVKNKFLELLLAAYQNNPLKLK